VECNGFRDVFKDFPAGTVVLGASADGLEKNKEFSDKNMYPYPLLCDTDAKLIKALGIEIAGKGIPQRITFVIDPDGKIAKIYDKVKPKGHAEEVLSAVKELTAKK
jgi:thioredoxin-dependent peroxiredoxin